MLHYQLMKIEFSENCTSCDRRPVCELAGLKARKLEETARKLGYTVTEGSIICKGRESRPEPWDPACGMGFIAPNLASADEREQIAQLEQLDGKASDLFPEIQRQLIELES